MPAPPPPPPGARSAASAPPLRVCMVCDFFFPRFGGVENHVWSMAQSLLRLGHKVVVVTHSYDAANGGDRHRTGVRWMAGGLKVYYAPLAAPLDQASLPTLFGFLPLLRDVLCRERIDIVHGHQATSQLTHEALFHARAMGLRTVYTDHSVFGFGDLASIAVNKVLRFTLAGADRCVCVSHTCRENLVLRACVDPARCVVLPNAVDRAHFRPDFSRRPRRGDPEVHVVVMSRMAYRKGIDLLVGVLPRVCARFPHVKFIIGGDGNKMVLLHEARERHGLHARVELVGHVPHARVRDTLLRGNIFLNCSLTESFCIAILEAASCGLFVVSTHVGGVAEVLPAEQVCYAEPTVDALVEAVAAALPRCKDIDTQAVEALVDGLYNWDRVAERTVADVYRPLQATPAPSAMASLCRYLQAGPLFGIIICMLFAVDVAFLALLRWLRPDDSIDKCPDWPPSPPPTLRVPSRAQRPPLDSPTLPAACGPAGTRGPPEVAAGDAAARAVDAASLRRLPRRRPAAQATPLRRSTRRGAGTRRR